MPNSTIFAQDRDGNLRVAGEEWLVKKIGAYLPGAYEEVVDVVDAYVLTDKVSELTRKNVSIIVIIIKCLHVTI